MLRGVLRVMQNSRLGFWCPGCEEMHVVNTDGKSPSWNFNGNYEKPTFTPSVLVRNGHYMPGHENGPCWCTYYKEHPEENADDGFKCMQCHSFVTDGFAIFLEDCSHSLAGKTIKLEPPP